jgi:HK97 family phage major capsid protein
MEVLTTPTGEEAIKNLIREKHTLLNAAKKLTKAAESRSLDASERKELDTTMSKLDDVCERVAALESRQSDEEDPEGDDEMVANGKGRSRKSPPIGRGRRSLPYLPKQGGYYGSGSWGIKTRDTEYSLGKAIRECVSGRSPTGLEGELSAECAHRNERATRGLGFFMPFSPSGDMEVRTDFPTTTSTASGGVTSEWSNDFLLMLRRQSIIEKLGIPVIADLKGNFVQPFETSGSTSQWVAEGSGVAAGAMAVSSVTGVPRALTTRYIITRQMIASSEYDFVDDLLFRDMVNATAEQVSLALVQGDQAVNITSPQGLLYNPSVDVSALGSPNTMSWNDLLGMQTVVSDNNPPEGSSQKFLVSPKGAQILRNRPRINTGSNLYPTFCMETLSSNDGLVNTIAGNQAVISPCVPDNLNASGASGGALTTVIFGAFGEAVRQCVWGNNIELLVDPYSLGFAGEIALYTYLLTDFITPRPSLLTTAFYN